MAERWAVATGNWSNTATWDGGTLPDPADDVFANNFTVTIDSNRTANSVSTRAGTTAVAGGNFALAAGVTLTAEVRCGSTECVRATINSPNAATITGNILPSDTTSSTAYAARLEGTGTLTINGNVTANSLNATNQATVFGGNGAGTVVVNGNVVGSSGTNTYGILVGSALTLTVNGNVTAGSVGGNNGIQVSVGTASITINGTLTGNNVAGNGGTNISAKAVQLNNALTLLRVRDIVCGDRGDFPISGPFKFLTQNDAVLEAIDASNNRFELSTAGGGLLKVGGMSGGMQR